jgi:hypothetical protein
MSLNRLSVVFAATAAVGFAQLPSQKILTVDVAQSIAQEAMAKCRADGYKVSVRVVDHANVLKAFVRDVFNDMLTDPACSSENENLHKSVTFRFP